MMRAALCLIGALAGCVPFNAAAQGISLMLPLDCDLGDTCFIQQLVDRDPGPDARDFTCGAQSYDGHQGTDIRVADMQALQQGWSVLAAAPGVVRAIRNTVPDTGLVGMPDGQDCGNGVLIAHADGWETQYCHMAEGSIEVAENQQVVAGQPLGRMGYSGRTAFPHLHITLRRNGAVIDPFDPSDTAACGVGATPVWRLPLSGGDVMSAGFADAVPTLGSVVAGTADAPALGRSAPALVLWGFFHSGQAGDTITLTITGPDGDVVHSLSVALERTQAQAFRAAGRRMPDGGWPAGAYEGTIDLIRDGAVISARSTSISLN